jgi:hypothetical protein
MFCWCGARVHLDTAHISRTTGITYYLSQETGDTSISLSTRESSRDAPRYSLTPGVVYFVNAITVQAVTTLLVNAVEGTGVGVGDSRGIGCDVGVQWCDAKVQ